MKLSVNTTDIEHFEELMREAPAILDDWLARADAGAVAQLEAAVKLGTPSCYGTLVNSIFGAPADAPLHGGMVGVSPPADVYGAAVEYGTRPHFPPPSALFLWVKKRFGLTEQKAIESAAWAVARKIAAGTSQGSSRAGVHMFEKAIQAEQANIQAIYGVAVDSAFGELQQGV